MRQIAALHRVHPRCSAMWSMFQQHWFDPWCAAEHTTRVCRVCGWADAWGEHAADRRM